MGKRKQNNAPKATPPAAKADAGKKPPKSPESYRKPTKSVRLKIVLAEIADSRAHALAQEFTQYVNDAVRMRLESEGAWPPKPEAK